MNLRNYSLSVAALLFFINGACFAQSQLPDTPAGNQAKGWLEVFNAGDVEKRRAFLQKNYPSRLERFDRETEMRRGTGGFDVMKVAESTPTKIVLLIQDAWVIRSLDLPLMSSRRRHTRLSNSNFKCSHERASSLFLT
jgi:hypothetical protein